MKRLSYTVALLGALFAINGLRAAAAVIEDVTEEGGTNKVLPQIIVQPAPVFPASLLKSGGGGKVTVIFSVTENGSVIDVVVTSSPRRQLNPYAIKTVGSWRFEPGTRNGQPATFRLRGQVEFSTNEQPPAPAKEDSPKAMTNEVKRTYDVALVAKRKPILVYLYKMVMAGSSGLC